MVWAKQYLQKDSLYRSLRKNKFIFLILFGILGCLVSSFVVLQAEVNTTSTDIENVTGCKYYLSNIEIDHSLFDISYLDIPVFPEYENLNCIGKVLEFDQLNSVIVIGSNSLLKNAIEILGYLVITLFSLFIKINHMYISIISFASLRWSTNNFFQIDENIVEIFTGVSPFLLMCFILYVPYNYPNRYSEIKKDSFRSDINFLRFFSVLSVVLYHIGNPLFDAGWLGVDIFFVISGYLICSSILDQVNKDNFTFKKFYIRRINRILPPLYLMLIFSFILSRLVLTDNAVIEFNKSFLSVVGLFANYFFRSNNLYTAEPSELVPLLHSWSLSIEEQFYLIFPLFIFLFWRYKREWTKFFLISVFIYSIFLNLGNFEDNDIFYITKFRLWELCFGVILVFINKEKLKISKYFYSLGYVVTISSVLLIGENVNNLYPKILALAGVSLIILNSKNYTELDNFLNNKVINIIGLSSYSIYLFHQPIFSYYRNLKETYLLKKSLSDFISFNETTSLNYIFTKNLVPETLLFILTILIGILSYKKIELSFIGSNKINIKSIILFFSLFCICIFTFIENSNYEQRFESEKYKIPTYDLKIEELDSLLMQAQINREIYVIGDSHVDMSSQFNYLTQKGFKINRFIEGNCFYIKNLYVSNDEPNLKPWCKDLHDQTEATLKNVKNSIILYGGILPNYIEDEQFFNGYVVNKRRSSKLLIYNEPTTRVARYSEIKTELSKTINEFADNNNIVVIIYPIPEAAWDVEKIIKIFPSFESVNLHYDYKYFYSRSKKAFLIYDELENKNIVKVVPSDLLCNNYIKEKCSINFNGSLFYKDYDHLNSLGNEILVDQIVDNLTYKLKNLDNKN